MSMDMIYCNICDYAEKIVLLFINNNYYSNNNENTVINIRKHNFLSMYTLHKVYCLL